MLLCPSRMCCQLSRKCDHILNILQHMFHVLLHRLQIIQQLLNFLQVATFLPSSATLPPSGHTVGSQTRTAQPLATHGGWRAEHTSHVSQSDPAHCSKLGCISCSYAAPFFQLLPLSLKLSLGRALPGCFS